MKLVLLSGLSGSGKSVALHALEDADYYCVDNLPPALLPALVAELARDATGLYPNSAAGIDVRSHMLDPEALERHMAALRDDRVSVLRVFLEASTDVLIKRFGETRRRHPLARRGLPLTEAIETERRLLAPLRERADLVLDTTPYNLHQLRRELLARVHPDATELTLILQSFGFKHGLPTDSDLIFDARALPNPYWVPELRDLDGRDAPIQAYLDADPGAVALLEELDGFLERWLPAYQADGRRFLTVSIGCSGGRHRSVWLCERLAARLRGRGLRLRLHHRELAQVVS
ncbi:MAG: nucleotide-binding protein [Gammaproteobacteria bacterium]|nr:MAG: nucleotide-binding protein [Gammaproteobacteria bacterium]